MDIFNTLANITRPAQSNKTSHTDYFGNIYTIGDVIEFQVLIAGRKHRSRSKVYGFTDDYVLISCNGIRKSFRLKFGEVIKIVTK